MLQVRRAARPAKAGAGILLAGAVDHYTSEFIKAQEKAGHDVGSAWKVIASVPFESLALAIFVAIGLIYLFWPNIQKLLAKRSQVESAGPQHQEVRDAVATALLKGHVERFESIDAYYVSDWERHDLERKIGRVPTASEALQAAFTRPSGPGYIAWLQVHTLGRASRATDWRASLTDKDGHDVPCDIVVKEWGPPPNWPQVKFYSIAEIYSMYLQNEVLYNVLLHVKCGLTEHQLNMRSCKVCFNDENGVEVRCSMQKPGTVK